MEKTLKDFTPEIQAKIPTYIKKYTEGIFDGKRYADFTKEKATNLINWNYDKCGYKKPVILIAENPYEAQLLFNYIVANKEIFTPIIYLSYCLINGVKLPVEILQLRSQLDSQLGLQLRSQLYSQLDSQLRSQLGSQLYSQLGSQLDSQLRSQLRSQLDSQLYSQLYSQLGSQLYSQLYSQLDSQLRSQLYSQLDSQLDSQLRSQLRSQLYSQLDSQLRSQLRSQLYSQLDSQLGTYHNDYLFTANVYSNYYGAAYKFIKDEFKIDSEIGITLDSWNNLYQESNVYSAIFSELICIVSKYPKKIHRNASNNLHNIKEVAVEWGNSTDITTFTCYYVNGRNVSKENFLKASENRVTKNDWLSEKNEDIKAAWFEILGSEKIMKILEAVEIDSNMTVHANGELEEHRLYKTPFSLPEIGEPLAWVKFICPSTGSNYLISVNPKFDKVMDAVLDTCPFYGQEINGQTDYKFNARG